jgi:hypothetical protein
MIYKAFQLLAKLRLLKLVGQNDEGELEWIGRDCDWANLDLEEARILRDWDINQS